jgi:hypothetical protein
MKKIIDLVLIAIFALVYPMLAGAIDIGNMTNTGTLNYYTTTGDKQVCTGICYLNNMIAASGTSVTATVWDAAGGTCNTGTQKTGVIPLTNGTPINLPGKFTLGICITVAGTSPTLTTSTQP